MIMFIITWFLSFDFRVVNHVFDCHCLVCCDVFFKESRTRNLFDFGTVVVNCDAFESILRFLV